MSAVRLLMLLGIVALLCGPYSVSASGQRCRASVVEVSAARSTDVKDACKAVSFATNFLNSVGLNLPPNVSIRLVSKPEPFVLGDFELGRFSSTQNAITVLDYRAAVEATRGNRAGLGRIVSRNQWRSYIVHELAHATVHMNRGVDCPSRSIHEYVASVAQISAIPRKELELLMSDYRDLAPFGETGEISEIYYAINPHAFAVKAYKHYQKLIDPRAFLQYVMGLSIE